MKKIKVFMIITAAALSAGLFYYFNTSQPALKNTSSCARVIGSTIYNILNDDDVRSSTEENFIISSYDEYTDHSEAGQKIKKQLEEAISADSYTKSLHPEKYEYYIEIKDKMPELVICARYRFVSVTCSDLNTYDAKGKSMNKAVKELYSDFVAGRD